MDNRKKGKAVDITKVTAHTMTKASYAKSTRPHKNSYTFIEDWTAQFMTNATPKQVPGLLQLWVAYPSLSLLSSPSPPTPFFFVY